MSAPLRFGVAGLGIATSYTLPVFAGHPGVRLAAAADVRRAALDRAEREYGVQTFDSVEDMCASPDVDAVYVATPSFLHEQHVLAAVSQGKHVIVEKPMAVSVAQCLRMVEGAERAGVQLVCGHTHSFNPPIRALHELSRGGSLGRLRMAHAWNYTDLLYRPRADWELDPARGGGVVFIQAPHQVDIVRLIGGGLVRSVRATTQSWDADRRNEATPPGGIEGAYTAYLEFEDGTPATLVYSGYAHFDSAELHDWVGERGQRRDPGTNAASRAAFVARTDEEAVLRDARRYAGKLDRVSTPQGAQHQFFGYMLFSFERADVRQSPQGLVLYEDGGRRELPVDTEPSGAWAMLDELCRAVETGTPAPHDGRWGAATLEVCEAILQSSRERGEMQLTHQVLYRG
ncbi:MAG TPA: Gfo/Idh/MocA family oxidoreductase [Chloroflexota bacterium]|nr:Gfo/Idh/MocA family oxidoreductase [Chloroflexota bacterium]